MPKDKYLRIFLRQIEAIEFIYSSSIFHKTRSFENWGTSGGYLVT